MKILVIGGTGHVGNYLVPKLLKNGHDVYVGTRGQIQPRDAESLQGAKFIKVNARDKENLCALKEERFDVIIDFPGSAKLVWDVLAEGVSHIIACGSLWMFGYPKIVPTPEIGFEKCFDKGYEIRYDDMLKMQAESGKGKAVFTAIMPPNICGPGKIPVDQYGGRSIELHKQMAAGEKVYIPDGPECVIGPCDAEDIAELFALAVENREAAAGQIFNVGSAYSLTTSEFIRAYARIYGVEIPIERVSWEKYIAEINPSKGGWWHFYSPMCPDISKARKLLGYEPRYTPEQTLKRAVDWMREQDLL
ncbi:MAG: NAD(P)-dependent oxidoreductase [Clostridia bacterium]|nr:NAD(P)-dependent oxidoreductase [Clostridia bacterium]